MNGHRPLRYRKKSAGGALERIELLRRHGIERGELGASASAPLDDVLDAAAAAWSAHRAAPGEAHSLPNPPQLQDGLVVAIWYWPRPYPANLDELSTPRLEALHRARHEQRVR